MADDSILSLFSNGGWRDLLGFSDPKPPPSPPQDGGPWGGAPPQPTNTMGYQGGMIPQPMVTAPPPNMAIPGSSAPPTPSNMQPAPPQALTSVDDYGRPIPDAGFQPRPPGGGTPGGAYANTNPAAPPPPPEPVPPQGGSGGQMAFGGPPPVNTSTGPVPRGGSGGQMAFGGPPSTPAMLPGAKALPAPPPGALGAGDNMGDLAGGLDKAFGLKGAGGKLHWGDALETGLAGLGKGLSQVGALKPGAPAAQAFAAGAGGGLEGGIKNIQERRLLDRLNKNDYFTHASNAYRDILAGVETGNHAMVASARARQVDLQYGEGGSKSGRNPLWNTEYGKAIQLDHDVSNETNQLRQQMDTAVKTLEKAPTLGYKPKEIEEMKKRVRDIQTKIDDVQGRKERLAKDRHIDLNAIKSGDDKQNAFDYDKLTPQQRLAIPEGKIYKAKDPKTGEDVYKRRKSYDEVPPYPGWQRPQQPGQQPAQQPQQAPQQTSAVEREPQAPPPRPAPPEVADLGDDEAA